MRYRILFLCLFSLLFIPALVYADNYTTKIDNHTVNIIVKPYNNTIIVDTDKIANIIQQLEEKKETDWNYGDVLIGSASIVGLFSVSSFVTTRFSEGTKAISARLLSAAIFVSGMIMVAQLYIMISIVTGFFNKALYDIIMMMTITAVFFIALTISRIIAIEHRGKRIDPNVDLENEVAGMSGVG